MRSGRIRISTGRPRRWGVLALGAGLAIGIGASVATAEEATVYVTLDHARVMPYPAGTETVILGNPIIADVTMLKAADRLILTGKAYGETNIVFLDHGGSVLSEARLRVRESAALLVVQRGTERESYSCQPRCQPAVSLGDSSSFLDANIKDIKIRDGLASGAAESGATPSR